MPSDCFVQIVATAFGSVRSQTPGKESRFITRTNLTCFTSLLLILINVLVTHVLFVMLCSMGRRIYLLSCHSKTLRLVCLICSLATNYIFIFVSTELNIGVLLLVNFEFVLNDSTQLVVS